MGSQRTPSQPAVQLGQRGSRRTSRGVIKLAFGWGSRFLALFWLLCAVVVVVAAAARVCKCLGIMLFLLLYYK